MLITELTQIYREGYIPVSSHKPPTTDEELERSAWTSPHTKQNAKAAASNESRRPIDRIDARLTTVSSASLAKVTFTQRRSWVRSVDRAAERVPIPSTRSRMPIVLIRSKAAPVGDSFPAARIGAPGAAIKAMPTDVRSHPIVCGLIVDIAKA
jgi:hypothetical protein